MFLEIVLFTILGIGVGVIAGITPGLHPNTIIIIVLSSTFLLSTFQTHTIIAFIVSVSVSNTLVAFIPSILFGAPEVGSELSVLPGHEMMLRGRAYEALFLTVVGGIGVVLLTILTFPLLLYVLPFLFKNISGYIQYLLIFVVIWMVVSENKKRAIYAALIFFLSGFFGLLSLNSFPTISIFPALTGLFGISGLILSLDSGTKIPKQSGAREVGVSFKGIFTGWLAGLLVGILPGVGSSQAGVIASNAFKTNKHDFLTTIGGINTANTFSTFIVFFTLQKTRSGAAAAVSQILTTPTLDDLFLIMAVGLITTFIAAAITLKIGKFMINKVEGINYRKTNMFIMASLAVLVFVFSGPIGLLILAIGTSIGLLTNLMKIRKSQMMGFFLLPTILYFTGLNPLLAVVLGV